MRCQDCNEEGVFDVRSEGVRVWFCGTHLEERLSQFPASSVVDALQDKSSIE